MKQVLLIAIVVALCLSPVEARKKKVKVKVKVPADQPTMSSSVDEPTMSSSRATDVPHATDAPECDVFCTMDYTPVCGSDGVTYSNECMLHSEACENEVEITVESEGVCQEPFMEGGMKLTDETVEEDSEPVCGPVCMMWCEHGNVMDDKGCPTCACNSAPAGCCYDLGFGAMMTPCCHSNFQDVPASECNTASRMGGATEFSDMTCSEFQASLEDSHDTTEEHDDHEEASDEHEDHSDEPTEETCAVCQNPFSEECQTAMLDVCDHEMLDFCLACEVEPTPECVSLALAYLGKCSAAVPMPTPEDEPEETPVLPGSPRPVGTSSSSSSSSSSSGGRPLLPGRTRFGPRVGVPGPRVGVPGPRVGVPGPRVGVPGPRVGGPVVGSALGGRVYGGAFGAPLSRPRAGIRVPTNIGGQRIRGSVQRGSVQRGSVQRSSVQPFGVSTPRTIRGSGLPLGRTYPQGLAMGGGR